ncbi:hypothetical protein [Xenorhabdus bovienii]|nr:hypothetical protein [Xenorhabdus bovienii]
MPRRQILTSEEKECLRIVPDDDILLTRMCFLGFAWNSEIIPR